MKKVLYISLLILASSCSLQKYNIFGSEVPYAEDVKPISINKIEKKASPIFSQISVVEEKKETAIIEEIQVAELEQDKFPSPEEVVSRPIDPKRAIVKAVQPSEFPNIKDIPQIPDSFPTEAEVISEKIALLEKTTAPLTEQNSFTGLDDELLVYATMEILSKGLPADFANKRSLLSASIGEELSIEDLTAIELLIKDRNNNAKPVLVEFHGNDLDLFKFDTVGTLILMGLSPSLIYVKDNIKNTATKAEIYLYY